MEQLDIFMGEVLVDEDPLDRKVIKEDSFEDSVEEEVEVIHEEIIRKEGTPYFQIGERVKVKSRLNEELMEPEDFYYLKDFSNKKGNILSVQIISSGKVSYEVDFDKGNIGFFYEEDLIQI
jgi:hypothetical protein